MSEVKGQMINEKSIKIMLIGNKESSKFEILNRYSKFFKYHM